MEITIKFNGRMVAAEVSAEVAECMGAGRRKLKTFAMNGGSIGMGTSLTST